jgi:hypothetical protein
LDSKKTNKIVSRLDEDPDVVKKKKNHFSHTSM